MEPDVISRVVPSAYFSKFDFALVFPILVFTLFGFV